MKYSIDAESLPLVDQAALRELQEGLSRRCGRLRTEGGHRKDQCRCGRPHTWIQVFDATLKREYGYGDFKNVVTSLEFERILSATGPYQGHVVRPSDHKTPERVAFIVCVGSRDKKVGNPYCSSVCCMYALRRRSSPGSTPGVEPTMFYMDIRAYGKGFDDYERARAENASGSR